MVHCQQMLCCLKKTNKTLRKTLYFTGVPIEGEVNEVFGAMSSLYLDIAEYISQKTLRKTVYFTGVPIEDKVNKVFWDGAKSALDIAEYIRQKHFRKPFTLRVCL